MKPFLVLIRIITVGTFWSIFFLEGIRVIMLKNWRFDILRKEHWEYAWDLWLSGWIISDAKEWAFVLIILTFIPLWLTGWAALSLIVWEKLILDILKYPVTLVKRIFFQQVQIISKTTGIKKVQKKKSYKEIRPKSVRMPMDATIYENTMPTPIPAKTNIAPKLESPAQTTPALPASSTSTSNNKFEHSLFKFDDDDDFDFDFDAFDDDSKKETKEAPKDEKAEKVISADPTVEKSNTKPNNKKDKNNKKDNNKSKSEKNASNAPTKSGSGNSVSDALKQKGYEVINAVTIKNNLIDFVGIAANQICLCLVDKDPGDWLADEERFNDEEPLWFSESSHRISPVRKASLAKQHLIDKLEEADYHFDVQAYVIEQIGNIINAEDMFEIWSDLNINVTRIDNGTPKELKLFTKTLDEAIETIDKDKLEKIKKLIRSIS